MRAFRLAYDGTGYRGFQRQPHGETVSDTILAAVAALDAFEGEAPNGYAAAGRTDAGVSARAQTIAFEAPAWLTPRALNSELPPDVRAWAAADVSADFHATYDATERHYRYFLYAPSGANEPHREGRGCHVDDDRVESACDRLSGQHDFHNFTPDDAGTERELSVEARRDGAFLVVDCRASGFARQLVRRLVSVLEAVGTGDRGLTFVDRALGSTSLSGSEGIPPADPEPLVLFDVGYPTVEFEVDEPAFDSACDAFGRRRRRRLAGVRVAETLCRRSDRESTVATDGFRFEDRG